MTPAAVLSILVKTQGVAAAAGDLTKLDKAGRRSAGNLDKVSEHAKRSSGSLKILGTAAKGSAALLGGFGLAKAFGALNSEYREAQKVGAQTNAVLKSTGDAAKVTQKHVENLAGAISKKVGIDDEEIQAAENMLLTFTKVRNETGKGNKIFDRATQAVTDMSVALGQSGKNSAIQLGKALNDPIKGVTALRRVGVTFDDQQQKQIKTLAQSGNMLGAQKLILNELAKEFGGSAAAQATAGDKLRVSLGNLAEAAGGVLVPQLDKAAVFFTKLINDFVEGKGIATVIIPIFYKVRDSIASVTNAVRRLADGFKQGNAGAVILVTTIVALTAAFVTYKTITAVVTAATKAMAAAQLALTVAMDANPIVLAVAALAGLAVALVIAYKKIKPFRDAVDATWAAIRAGVSAVIAFVRQHWVALLGILTGPFGPAVVAIVKHFGDIKQAAGRLPGQIANAIKSAPGLLLNAGEWMVDQILNGIKSVPGKIADAASWLKDKIVGAIKSIFGIHSPSTVMADLGLQMAKGLLHGFGGVDVVGFVKKQVGSLASSAAGAAGRLLNLGGGDNGSMKDAGKGGSARQWLQQALRITGQYTPANYAALYKQMMSESGGNPKAINLWDSNAKAGHPSKGLLQTIDSTFQSYRLSSLPNDIYNPVANAVAAIRYMLARYGHIVGTGHGYADGTGGAAKGLAWVGERGPELVNFTGGEQVLSHGASMRLMGYASGTSRAQRIAAIMRHRASVKGLSGDQATTSVSVDSGSGDDPNQPLIDALAADAAAQQALADQLAGVRDELAKQTAFASSVQATSNFQLTKSLADLVSGRIVGYGVAGRAFTPGTGVEIAY